MNTSANIYVDADTLFRQKPQIFERKHTGCKADAHLLSLQIISQFFKQLVLAVVRACSPEQVAWVTGLTPLLFWLCCCGCSASCLHLLPFLHPMHSHAAESSFSETQRLDFASAARCCGGGELAEACWGSALLCCSVGLMYFQAKCSKLHSLLTQAFEKTDVLQQDDFTKLFVSYSLFDTAFGEARRNGKTQLNILTYSSPMGRQETSSWLLPVFLDCH